MQRARRTSGRGRTEFLEFMFMNDVFMNGVGAAYPITTSIIDRSRQPQRVQVRNHRRLKAGLVARLSDNS
jgi:hypothetical protein